MPLGLFAGLSSLTSLTGGGALQSSTPSTSTADSAAGPVNVGGLNVPALPSQTNALVIGAVVLGVAWFVWGRK